jgi:RND family efflux transporter MFP subunit
MKLWLKIGIPLLLGLLLIVWFSRQLKVPVLVEEASEGTAVNAVTGTVEVLAHVDIRIKAQNRGTLVENTVAAGQVVEAGELIGQQDSAALDLNIEQVEIRLEAARARAVLESTHRIDLESIDVELEGVKLAVDLQQAPNSKLQGLLRERRKKEVLWQLEEIQASETRQLLENQLAQLLLQREQMSTFAPFAGTVAEINAFKGDLINSGQNMVRLVSHGRFVLMELSEEDYFGVEDGMPVTLRLASYPDRTFEGTVQRLEDVANAKNKTRNVFVEVDAPDTVLVPGLTGEGYLVKDERSEAILIPRRALIGNLVYVVEGGKVEVRRVRAGYLGLKEAEILEGIKAGDLIILEDQNMLKPGERVKVVRSGRN